MIKEVELHFSAEKDSPLPREEVEKILDREVERFSNFMANLGDWRGSGALSNPEKMLLKTYLIQKYRSRFEAP